MAWHRNGRTRQNALCPRLCAVIDGEQGGISEAEKWHGGGGFRFMRLGDEIFTQDGAVNPKINFSALAAHLWFAETHTPLPRKNAKARFWRSSQNRLRLAV